MAYREWEPGEKFSSPASSRTTLRVRNRSDERGKFSLKFGDGDTEQFSINSGQTEEFDCGTGPVVGVNKGKVELEWQRS